MFLPLLCLGTILAPTYPASCQPNCSPLLSSGSVGAAAFHPFSCSTTAPTRFCTVAPRSFTIRVRSRDEVVAISHIKACTAADAMPGSPRRRGRPPGLRPGGPAVTKRVSFSDPPSSSLAPPQNGPGTVFLPGKEVFACPGTAGAFKPPQTQYGSRQWAPPKRLDL